MLVGVISDTHGLVRPEALAALAGVEHIVHAGDIGGPEVLAALRAIAPVTAVRGNNDREPWAAAIRERETITLGATSIHVLHDVKELALDPMTSGVHAVIAGHSHRPRIERVHGVLFLNPGSAGPRRFSLPVSVARLRVDGALLEADIIELDVAPTARR
jgi:putative phosphoesterase